MVRQRIFRGIVLVFGLIGLLFSAWFVIGMAQDINAGDETTGGYEYPYTGWTGTPIAYDRWHVTGTGLYQVGRIVDQSLDCTTGQLRFHVLRLVTIDFREFSDRAKVVHQPQVACRELGYDTSTWDAIDDPQGLFTELTSADGS